MDERLQAWLNEWKLAGAQTEIYSNGAVAVGPQKRSSRFWTEVIPLGPKWEVYRYGWAEQARQLVVFDDLDEALDCASEYLRNDSTQ
jgi:hypothetical protein